MSDSQEMLAAIPAGSGRRIRGTVAILAFVLMALRAWSAAPAAKTLVLADFEKQDALRLTTDQAESRPVPLEGGHALEITTEAAASYPGVKLEPPAGRWDLRGFGGLAMDVRNPQDVAVRVLLLAHNPGSDGRTGSNAGSITVAPRGRARLVVPFGVWHGETDHPLDLVNVVSVQVILDRPGRAHRFVVDNIRAVSLDESDMDDILADPFFRSLKPAFGRGVNLGNALEAPKEGEWGVTLKEEYFDHIKSAGFDSVRIPVRWSAHAGKEAPYTIEPAFLARVDWAVRQCMDRKLQAVLNIHHYDEIVQQPDQHRERFLALWKQIAEHYRGYPDTLAFELLNEPHSQLTADRWNAMLADAIAVIRKTNPKRRIVVGPVGWNNLGELAGLTLPEKDRNLVVTFHYYSPFQFTHQGASWVGDESEKWLGTKWTGTPAERNAVTRDLDTALRWAVENKRPIYMGEFGAFSRADLESRARWTKFVADEALKRRIGFAYWEFCAGFGVYDPERRAWVEPLKQALVPGGRKE